jgi:hypothetical protein
VIRPQCGKFGGLGVLGSFVEVETGKGCDTLDRRPQLAAALAMARTAKAAVVVAKLDRLSRDVSFVAGLMSRVWRAREVPFCRGLGDAPLMPQAIFGGHQNRAKSLV